MTNLVHQPIEERTLERWVENFQEEIAGTVTNISNVEASYRQLENYVLFVENRFGNRLFKYLPADVCKVFDVNKGGARTLYTSMGPLALVLTVDPLVGYVNDRPWYVALKRNAFNLGPPTSNEVLYDLVRAELQLYLEAFPSMTGSLTTLPVYTSLRAADGWTFECRFGELMPFELRGRAVRCECEHADLGATRFLPCYANSNLNRRAVNPAARFVRREGEW